MCNSPAKVHLVDAVSVFLQNFLNSSSCPEIQGYLHLKEPGRKSWKKLYMFLRRSGLYYSTKGTSKVMNYCRRRANAVLMVCPFSAGTFLSLSSSFCSNNENNRQAKSSHFYLYSLNSQQRLSRYS